MMKTTPVVFSVHDMYQIMVPTSTPSLMWVRVGEKNYYDDSNGILRSRSGIHRMTVPACELDKAHCYTICEKEIIERRPYWPQTEDVKETEIPFTPVKFGAVRCFHVADTHNRIVEPVQAAKHYGQIDFLIMNGDIPRESDQIENFDTVYDIASQITGGRIPIVFARGNHELRGIYAEKFEEYCPNENGCTYFTFRLGGIWGIVLDCGEDKDDSSAEYGGTICCHAFRERETEFIRRVAAGKEYEEEGITQRVVVVHNPFTRQMGDPTFDIEADIYSEWAKLLKEEIGPDVMICGHLHSTEVYLLGCEQDHLGQPCPVIVGAKPGKNWFAGTGIAFDEEGIHVTFVDSDGKMLGQQTLGRENWQ